MNEADSLLKDYFGKLPTPKDKARLSLAILLLTLGGYNLVGNLGLAGVLVFQSPKGRYLCLKTTMTGTNRY